MYNYLVKIEKQLCSYLSVSVLRRFSRTVTDNSIILRTNSHYELSVTLSYSCICISYADEFECIDITDISDITELLEIIGTFINELVTGTLIYERTYYGRVQAKCRVTLVNRISKRNVHLRDTVLTSQYAPNVPRLVLHEKVFFG